jgi:hypothetical protein
VAGPGAAAGTTGFGGFGPVAGGSMFAGFGGFAGGLVAGSGGSFSPPTCIWGPGFCMFPDGSQCNGFTCCAPAPTGDRCCDGTGRCGGMIPPPPPWVPPIPAADVGEPGWKQSTEPLCPGNGEIASGSVWSDSRGVYVTTTVYNYNPMLPTPEGTCFGCPHAVVEHNDGTGWRTIETAITYGQQRLKGFEGGALILYGSAQTTTNPIMSCGLALLNGGTLDCEPVDGVSDVAVTGTTAYAALAGELVRYDGTSWGPVPVAFPGQRELFQLWANQDVVIGTGSTAGRLYSLRGNAWTIEDTRTLETFTTVFGFASNDIWAGTAQEHLFHYDGTAWTQVSWPGGGCTQAGGIYAMWGKDGVLFFATPTSLSRWNGTNVEVIAKWDCTTATTTIGGMWGNSPTELFVLMSDYSESRQPCGSQFLMHYDGSKFHRM